MGLKITNRKFFTDYFNGSDFSLNPSDNKPHLYGSVSNMTKAVYQIDVDWTAKSSLSSTWTQNGDTLTRSSGSFRNDLFSIGDIVDVEVWNYNVSPPVLQASGTDLEVTGIGDDFIIIDSLIGAGINNLQDYGGREAGLFEITIKGKTPLEGFLMNFGVIGNDDPINFNSALDGTTQGYYAGGVGLDTGGGRDTNFVDCNFLGLYRSSKTGSMRVRYVNNPDTYTQRFEIEHIFRIIPYYLDGQEENLQNLITPDAFSGDNSLKYVTKHEFRNVLSDPNTSKIIEDDIQLGSVSWFNENYNGFNNIFSISNLTYEDAATNPANSLIVGGLTTVKFRVTSLEASFVNGSSIIQVFSSYLPAQDEYEKKELDYSSIWEIEQYRDVLGNNTATGQPIIQNLQTTFIDSSNIDVEIKILYSSKTSSQSYVLGVEVSNDGVTAANSNKTLLLVDYNTFQKSACIEDLLYVTKYDIIDAESNLVNSYGGYDEDGILLDWEIQLNHDREAVINEIEVLIVAFNPTTNDYFAVSREVVPLQVVANKNDGFFNYQEITSNVDTNYKLADNDAFRFRTINTGALAGSLRTYSGQFGVKIPWLEFVSLPGASEQFTDANKPFNGLNKLASNYNNLNGYELRPWIKFSLSGLDDLGNLGSTDYFLSKEGMNIGGYNDNPDVSVTFELSDSLGNPITGGLLTNENTKVKIIVSPLVGSLNASSYGVLRLEPNNSSTERNIYEHNEASIKSNYAANAFVGNLTKSLVGSNLEFLSEIKKEFINENTPYKLSFMLKCPILQAFTFQTSIDPGINGSFDPAIITYSGLDTFTWEFEDLSQLTGASISTTGNGLNGTIQDVKILVDDLNKIEAIDFNNDKIQGVFNATLLESCYNFIFVSNDTLTGFTIGSGVDLQQLILSNCGITGALDISSRVFNSTINGSLVVTNNPSLTDVILGSNFVSPNGVFEAISCSSLTVLNLQNITDVNSIILTFCSSLTTINLNPTAVTIRGVFNASLSNLNGTLDLSKVNFISTNGQILVNNNLNLTTILNPITAGEIEVYYANSCNITGVLDISGLTGLKGDFRVNQNSNLTNITNPVSSGIFSKYWANDCNITGTLDLSGLTGLSGEVFLYNNPGLNIITLPVATTTITDLRVYNCNLNSINILDMPNMTDVSLSNYRFEDNTMSATQVNKILVDLDAISSGGFFSRIITINGTNAAPDGTSGGLDGLAAKASLQGKGFIVNTN